MRIPYAFMLFLIFLFSCKKESDAGTAQNPEAEIVIRTLTHQNLERKFTLFIPSSYRTTTPAPLVIFLHGGSGNMQSAQSFTNFNEVAEKQGFILAYPQAYFEAAPGSYVWNDGRIVSPGVTSVDDVDFINVMVEEIQKLYAVNDRKIYLCGFSNGSFLAHRIAFEKNRPFAAIGVIGGTLSEDLYNSGNPNRAIPMLFMFGTDDPLVPYEGGIVTGSNTLPIVGIEQAVNYWVENNGCGNQAEVISLPDIVITDQSRVSVTEYTSCSCNNARVVFYKVQGAGHTWPGLVSPNPDMLGISNLDIFASQEIWNFFSAFELCP